MIVPLTYQQVRPNRLTETKDEQYHLDYARWCLGIQQSQLYRNFQEKTIINWNFYQNNQWIFDEDLTHFLLDESGEARHRIKLSRNLIRRVVEFYRGMAIDMKFKAKAEVISPFTINRRNNELHRMKFLSYASKKAPAFSKMMEATLPIGRDEQEVEEMFKGIWTDEVADMNNDFLKFVMKDIKADRIKNELAKHLAMSGLAVYKGSGYNGRYKGEAIDPLFFFFDMNAKRPDLKDAAYMGENHYWDCSTIFERYQHIRKEDKDALEKFSTTQYNTANYPYYYMLASMMGWSSNNVPSAEVYWNDTERKQYGWVKDNADYPMFCLINDPNSPYKEKDLIEPPKEFQATYKKEHGKLPEKKETCYIDIVRFATFIPGEIIGSARKHNNQKNNDILLEHGIVPYQDKNSFNFSEAVFPYKCGTWSYNLGNICSPIDDLIDTQRLQNRLLSAAESVINNSGSAGTIIEKEAALDDPEGEAGVENKVKRGKTVFVNSGGKGVPQMVMTYDNTIKGSATNMFGVIKELSGSMDEISGINQAMLGTQSGSGQLSGVTNSHVNQGTILLQPFFQVIKDVLEDACDDMLAVGMKIYGDNPRQLAIMVGDNGASIVRITKEMRLEDNDIAVKWETEPELSTIDMNGLLVQMFQGQLIDRDTFDNLFGRATMDSLARAVREYGKTLKIAQIQQARQEPAKQEFAQKQVEKAHEEMKGEQRRQEGREDLKDAQDMEFKHEQVILKGKMALQRDREKNREKKK